MEGFGGDGVAEFVAEEFFELGGALVGEEGEGLVADAAGDDAVDVVAPFAEEGGVGAVGAAVVGAEGAAEGFGDDAEVIGGKSGFDDVEYGVFVEEGVGFGGVGAVDKNDDISALGEDLVEAGFDDVEAGVDGDEERAGAVRVFHDSTS